MNELSQIIKQARKKTGLTQKEVSESLNYSSPQFISCIERGTVKIPLEVLGQLVKKYDINRTKVKKILMKQYAETIEEAIN